jgi:hypothetical protein
VVVVQAPDAGSNATLTVCSTGQPANMFAALGGADTGGAWTGPSQVNGGLFDPSTMVAGDYTYTVNGTAPCVAASATVGVVVDPCLGIEDLDISVGIRWFGQDQGTQHHFVLEGAILRGIALRDIMGRSVPAVLQQQAGGRWALDMAGRSTGAYVLFVTTDRGAVWTRLVHEMR